MNPFLGYRRSAPEQPATNRRTWGQRIVLAFNVMLIASSLFVASTLTYANERAASINRIILDRSLTELPDAERGERVINVLLVGSDSSANLDPDDPIQIGRQGERLGDVIIIAHIDERSGQVALLSLPRDLYVPIAGSEREHRINRAFLVGGPAALIDTIEENFGIPIHHYINVDFAGFQGLVEAVGTVEVYFDAPARDWNVNAVPEPRSQTGFLVEEAGCHALDPVQALAYVRSRYYQTQDPDGDWITDPTSDLGRIRRQQAFLERLLQTAIDQGARNPLVLGEMIDVGVQNVAIDSELTPALLLDLSSTYRAFEPGDLQSYTFPVIDGTVGSNRVLLPLTDAAEPILALFAGEPFDSPATIGVELVYDPALAGGVDDPALLPPAVAALAGRLEAAGFTVLETREESVAPGLYVRHSTDGAQAGELVSSILWSPGPAGQETMGSLATAPVTEPSSLLNGRNVVVAIGTGVAIDSSDAASPSTLGDDEFLSAVSSGGPEGADGPSPNQPSAVPQVGAGQGPVVGTDPLGPTTGPAEVVGPTVGLDPEASLLGAPAPCAS